MDLDLAIRRAVAELDPEATIESAVRLTGGVSAEVYGLHLTGGTAPERLVVRRHRPSAIKEHGAAVAEKEFDLLSLVGAHRLPVPHPLLVTDADGPTLLMEWVEGTTSLNRDDLDSALPQMADVMAGIHAIDLGGAILRGLGELDDPVPYLDLTTPAPAARNRPVLVHADYWPGNLLWSDGRLVAVLDWEDAAVGDPLADLAGTRVELLCAYGRRAMDTFTARYLERMPHLDTQRLPLWDTYVATTALDSMADWGLAPADEVHRRHLTTEFLAAARSKL